MNERYDYLDGGVSTSQIQCLISNCDFNFGLSALSLLQNLHFLDIIITKKHKILIKKPPAIACKESLIPFMHKRANNEYLQECFKKFDSKMGLAMQQKVRGGFRLRNY
jgi:hypothetical protein